MNKIAKEDQSQHQYLFFTFFCFIPKFNTANTKITNKENLINFDHLKPPKINVFGRFGSLCII